MKKNLVIFDFDQTLMDTLGKEEGLKYLERKNWSRLST